MKTVIKTSLCILLILGVSAAAQDVYKDVDEDGVPSFSDQAMPGAQKVDVRPTTTYKSEDSIPKPSSNLPRANSRFDDMALGDQRGKSNHGYRYKTVSITNPDNNSSVRDNAGNLTLTVKIEPSLHFEHEATLVMDGIEVEVVSGSGPVSLANVDRGTHVFSVRITDERDKLVKESQPVSLTMQRYSVPRPRPR